MPAPFRRAMTPATSPRSLEELRKAYHANETAHGGHCQDAALSEALVQALEKELARVSSRMERSGTVYHMPKTPKPGTDRA